MRHQSPLRRVLIRKVLIGDPVSANETCETTQLLASRESDLAVDKTRNTRLINTADDAGGLMLYSSQKKMTA